MEEYQKVFAQLQRAAEDMGSRNLSLKRTGNDFMGLSLL